MNKPKLTFNEVVNSGKDAAKHYGLTSREIDATIKEHFKGAPRVQLREAFEEFYRKENK